MISYIKAFVLGYKHGARHRWWRPDPDCWMCEEDGWLKEDSYYGRKRRRGV